MKFNSKWPLNLSTNKPWDLTSIINPHPPLFILSLRPKNSNAPKLNLYTRAPQYFIVSQEISLPRARVHWWDSCGLVLLFSRSLYSTLNENFFNNWDTKGSCQDKRSKFDQNSQQRPNCLWAGYLGVSRGRLMVHSWFRYPLSTLVGR